MIIDDIKNRIFMIFQLVPGPSTSPKDFFRMDSPFQNHRIPPSVCRIAKAIGIEGDQNTALDVHIFVIGCYVVLKEMRIFVLQVYAL